MGFTFSAPLDDVHLDAKAGKINVAAKRDEAVTISLEFDGEVVPSGAGFSARRVSVRILPINNLARSEFVASSLEAALALAERTTVKLRGAGVNFGSFDLSLREISELLRTRETSLRLMIIGKAVNVAFDFPPHLSAVEVQTIAFLRHAIIDRQFTWPIWRHPLSLTADRPTFEKVKASSGPARIGIPRQVTEALLGHEIGLGLVNILMEQAVIEDADRVMAEVAMLDGHEVQAFVRSLAGRATIECPQAPTLPENSWTSKEQALIWLEETLVARVTERYNVLATSTLTGLSDNEKKELTEPEPGLGELLSRGEETNTP
jgi:hypothetical protein